MTTQPHLQSVPVDPQAPVDSSSNFTSTADGTLPPPGGGVQPPAGNRSASKPRSKYPLPSDRLTFDKQVEVLTAIAQMGGSVKRPVTAEECSGAVGLKGDTGGLSNRFFAECGWVDFIGRGQYAASDALVEWYRESSIDPDFAESAREHLRRPLTHTWFWGVLQPLLGPAGIKLTIAIMQLSRAAETTDHTAQLHLVISWLEWVGLVRKDGELLFLAPTADIKPAAERDHQSLGEVADEMPTEDKPIAGTEPESESEPGQQQAQPQEVTARQGATVADESLVSFSFNVRITADDAAKLSSEQLDTILAFAEKLRG